MHLLSFNSLLTDYINLNKKYDAIKVVNGQIGELEIIKEDNRIYLTLLIPGLNGTNKTDKIESFIFNVFGSDQIITITYKGNNGVYSRGQHAKINNYIDQQAERVFKYLSLNKMRNIAKNVGVKKFRATSNLMIAKDDLRIIKGQIISEDIFNKLPKTLKNSFEIIEVVKHFNPRILNITNKREKYEQEINKQSIK